MTRLSVNLNKIALLRNSRGADNPGPAYAAEVCIASGAHGITLHLREDRRHAREDDVREIARLCVERGVEFNLEGDPRPDLVELALELRPTQLTLVPVSPGEVTSNHGWDLQRDVPLLSPVVAAARAKGIRVSLFVDADAALAPLAARTGAERIEIYTEPYAAAFGTAKQSHELERVRATARAASAAGLGVNAGHDLDLYNLPSLVREVPEVEEVSIGHALVADALYLGLQETLRRYLQAARGLDVPTVRTK